MERAVSIFLRTTIICLILSACGGGNRSTTVSGEPGDPLYIKQWHLNNTGQTSGTPGEDINVLPAWNSCADSTCRGEGIRIAVVDDGLQINHPDLFANVASGLSHNYLTGTNDPSPTEAYNGHGTSVAGIIAARDLNNIGVRGVSPRANLVAYTLLNFYTSANEADAMIRGSPDVHVSSNSWGAEDNTGELYDPLPDWKAAIDTGLNNGRNGRGTIYVWAAGNGGSSNVDNANYDGYTNQRGVIAVAALNQNGVKSSYAEQGANILISAPGGEFCDTNPAITTTDLTGTAGMNVYGQLPDLSNNNYTQCMNGTSAATPMVSGAAALMLQANPNLGWRDVRYILATTARRNNANDGDWFINNSGTGYPVNHKYGFGALNTAAAVSKARNWINLGPQLMVETTPASFTPIPILDYDPNVPGAGTITETITISNSGIGKIDTVQVTFSAADHAYAGDLQIILTSPAGTQSVLAETHACLQWNGNGYEALAPCTSDYNNWTFSSVRHLDETADGDWKLSVKDGAAVDFGTFQSWTLRIYGRAN